MEGGSGNNRQVPFSGGSEYFLKQFLGASILDFTGPEMFCIS
jgi:hypothetical protein